MNPLFQAAAGSILRTGLQWLAAFIVARGMWTQEEATTYVAAAAVAILGLGWSLWNKYKARLTFLAALTGPQTTESSAQQQAAAVPLSAGLSIASTRVESPHAASAVAQDIQVHQ